jgi:hypothetical protein
VNPGQSATVQQSVKRAKARLSRFLKAQQELPMEILQREAANIQTEAKAQTPVESGKLESHVRVKVTTSKTRPGLNISASARSKGGYNYAGIQHENTEFKHPIKGKDHFLSDPFNAGVERIKQAMSKEIKDSMR